MAAYSTQDSENYHSQNNREVPEESPELLRWRADALLDEMMLGGIDASAASPTRMAPNTSSSTPNNRSSQSAQGNGSFNYREATNGSPPIEHRDHSPSAAYRENPAPQWDQPFNNTHAGDSAASPPGQDTSHQNGRPSIQDTDRQHDDGAGNRFSPALSNRPDYRNARPDFRDATDQPWGQSPFPRTDPTPTEPPRGQQSDEPMLRPPSAVGARHQQSPYSSSFLGPPPQPTENRYQPPVDDRQPTDYRQPGEPPVYPYPDPAAADAGRPYGQPSAPGDFNEPFAPSKEPKPWSVVSGGPGDYLTSVPRRNDTPYSAPQTRYTYDPVLGPTSYQQQTARFADSMAVGAQARRRTNVWPRHSRFDIQALQQEMNTLQEQIDLLVRRRLDISERAQHLLDKGRTILENDPDRSAEVTYYVQQVRTMVQRTGQRVQWSNVYRTRLFTYLTAWLGLSAVVLAGCILYSDLMRLWLGQLAAFALDGFLSQHIVALLGTLASATLGSAFAALINAWRHSQKEYGYFDRKYGLLGAVLPLIGLLVGLLLYLALGAIYWLFEINPQENPVAAWIPAIVAFAFGASQEKIYGTAE
ncbi:MAG: hypothetical protein R2911_16475 [Caldilineaceae bacterium]